MLIRVTTAASLQLSALGAAPDRLELLSVSGLQPRSLHASGGGGQDRCTAYQPSEIQI